MKTFFGHAFIRIKIDKKKQLRDSIASWEATFEQQHTKQHFETMGILSIPGEWLNFREGN